MRQDVSRRLGDDGRQRTDANTAYLDLAADARVAFFAEHGFAPVEFRRLGIGPVIRRDDIEYFREIALHETCRAMTGGEVFFVAIDQSDRDATVVGPMRKTIGG